MSNLILASPLGWRPHWLVTLAFIFTLSGCGVVDQPAQNALEPAEQPPAGMAQVPFLLSWPEDVETETEAQHHGHAWIFDVFGVIDTLLGDRHVSESAITVPFQRVSQVLVIVLGGVSYDDWRTLQDGGEIRAVERMGERRETHPVESMWTPAGNAEGGEAFWENLAADRDAALFISGSSRERLNQAMISTSDVIVALLSTEDGEPFDQESALLEISEEIADALDALRESGRLHDMAVILTATHNLDSH